MVAFNIIVIPDAKERSTSIFLVYKKKKKMETIHSMGTMTTSKGVLGQPSCWGHWVQLLLWLWVSDAT